MQGTLIKRIIMEKQIQKQERKGMQLHIQYLKIDRNMVKQKLGQWYYISKCIILGTF